MIDSKKNVLSMLVFVRIVFVFEQQTILIKFAHHVLCVGVILVTLDVDTTFSFCAIYSVTLSSMALSFCRNLRAKCIELLRFG